MKPRAGETDAQIKARIRDSLGRFFGATKPDDLLNVVRDPQRVKPLIEDYYSRKPFEMPRIEGISSAEEGMVNLKPIWVVEVRLEDFGTKLVLVQDSERGFLVDWETFVIYNPVDWDDYLEARPGDPMSFRVYAKLDHNPGYAFADPDEWVCVELTAFGSGEELYGYARRGSETARRLEEELENQFDWQCIVELQFPEDAKGGDNQVHLLNVLTNGWIWVD